VVFLTRDGGEREATLSCEIFEQADAQYALAIFQQVSTSVQATK